MYHIFILYYYVLYNDWIFNVLEKYFVKHIIKEFWRILWKRDKVIRAVHHRVIARGKNSLQVAKIDIIIDMYKWYSKFKILCENIFYLSFGKLSILSSSNASLFFLFYTSNQLWHSLDFLYHRFFFLSHSSFSSLFFPFFNLILFTIIHWAIQSNSTIPQHLITRRSPTGRKRYNLLRVRKRHPHLSIARHRNIANVLIIDTREKSLSLHII